MDLKSIIIWPVTLLLALTYFGKSANASTVCHPPTLKLRPTNPPTLKFRPTSLPPAICHLPPAISQRLDSFVAAIANNNMGMGSLAISKNGKVIYQKAFGYADLDSLKPEPNTPDTRFRIGSITKMFTAVLVFKMIDEGKLRLNSKVSEFYPQLPNADKITIRDLLYHRSGLHNYSENTEFEKWFDQPVTQEKMLGIIVRKGLDFETGTKAAYSNSNYLVLSYILEKINGTSYKDMLNSKIIFPLRLKGTYYGSGTDLSEKENYSYKYAAGNWIKEKQTHMSIHSGAGSLISTSRDLILFAEALFNGKLLKKEYLQQMQELKDGYGMGMFPYVLHNKQAFGHSGRIDGFSSTLQYFQKEKIAVAYCTNGIVFPKEDVIDGVMHILFNKPYEIPDFNSPALDTSALKQYTGEYSSTSTLIRIKCYVKDGILVAETQGQPFPLQSIRRNTFCNAQFGFFFEFRDNELILKEGDNVYHLHRGSMK